MFSVDSLAISRRLHQFIALEAILNLFVHFQVEINIDKFLAKPFLDVAGHSSISMLNKQS